jgi:hypothetical protein
MRSNETNISAQSKETGKNSWIFEKNVDPAGTGNYQQTQGERKEAAGFIMILENPVFILIDHAMRNTLHSLRAATFLG